MARATRRLGCGGGNCDQRGVWPLTATLLFANLFAAPLGFAQAALSEATLRYIAPPQAPRQASLLQPLENAPPAMPLDPRLGIDADDANIESIERSVLLPLNEDGSTLNTEFLNSRQPYLVAGEPASVGEFMRGLIRIRIPVIRKESQTLSFSNSDELITQTEESPALGVDLSRDRYVVDRLGLDWLRYVGSASASVNALLSRGLDARDGTTILPTSRQAARPRFTTFSGTARVTVPGPRGFSLDLMARGQTSFGTPQFISEQFALDAVDGVSENPYGSFNVDAGATLRIELRCRPLLTAKVSTIQPYLFGANGWGWIERPAAFEQRYVTAQAAGFGGRMGFDAIPGFAGAAASVSLEAGHQFSTDPGRGGGERVNLAAALRF